MDDVRVRFAPSPTGLMHLGNVRAALMNYLFARQKNGTFILRVEDTDPERNFDPGAVQIMQDLAWLGLSYHEGPPALEPFGPYFQSKRTEIYQKDLEQLRDKELVYRCFCSPEELEKKRKRQIALKQPPRYDRTCLKLTPQEIERSLAQRKPFIWRFKIDQTQSVTITDLARGSVTFDLQHFSDFPITRTNGSFTFMFANCVDDIHMRISHVLRGEDHLSNTGNQAALYLAFQADVPQFWHLPILCNIEGQKLSKRDFGFSLKDLKDAGFLPEAILNYLAITGGSYEQEVMDLDELARAIDFEDIHATGPIKYDVQKLTWMNHQWILRKTPEEIAFLCKPYLIAEFPHAQELTDAHLVELIIPLQGELDTLADCTTHIAFYFRPPVDACILIEKELSADSRQKIVTALKATEMTETADTYVASLKAYAQERSITTKDLFSFLRIALTGATRGPSIVDIIKMLGFDETRRRLEAVIQSC